MPKQNKILIMPDMQVEDLVQQHPQIISLLMHKGIVCIKGGEPYWGTIGELIKSKRMDSEKILLELNRELNKA